MFANWLAGQSTNWRRVTVHVRSRLVGPVLLVGLVGGLAGAAYLAVLHLLQSVLGPEGHGVWIQGLILVGAGGIVALGTRALGPTGNVELLVDNIHVSGGAEGVRETRSMVPISLVCVAAGGTLGPEAPLVQTTGTIGSWWAQRAGFDREATRILTITGMAAGFTVLFGAPLGGALFALEILHRRGLQYYEAIMPALLGSLAGYAVAAVLLRAGLEPVWHFPGAGAISSTDLGWAVAAGVAGAIVAWGFAALVDAGRWVFGFVPPSIRPVVGGLTLAILAAGSPFVLTNGEEQINELLAAKLTVAALVVAMVAKIAGTIVTMVSGWKGGFIIPLFFLGAAAGELIHTLVPSTNESVIAACLMVAFCVGVTKTPLGSTLVVTEMAGIALLPTTIVAAVVTLFLSERVRVIETQRDRHAEAPDDADGAPGTSEHPPPGTPGLAEEGSGP
jgi:H+/Cl- antiporter ClcA